jgi:alpha-glucosidase/alpha-D-xyloside xylohydrolase
MPIYVRAGAIIPVDAVRQYTSEVVEEATTLKIFSGADGEFVLYEDDGISQEYLAGKGSWIRMTWDEKKKQLALKPFAPKGSVNIPTARMFNVEMIPGGMIKRINYTGTPVSLSF